MQGSWSKIQQVTKMRLQIDLRHFGSPTPPCIVIYVYIFNKRHLPFARTTIFGLLVCRGRKLTEQTDDNRQTIRYSAPWTTTPLSKLWEFDIIIASAGPINSKAWQYMLTPALHHLTVNVSIDSSFSPISSWNGSVSPYVKSIADFL